MPPIQMLVSVSKRHFKHAVDRNRCKRQVREAYRLNKAKVTAAVPEGKSVHIAFIWLADTQQPSALVHSKTQRLLGDIAKSL